MALADYYQRSALAVSQILAGFDEERFRATLVPVRMGLAFGPSAVDSLEGRALLDMTVRLLARLYPTLVLVPSRGAEDQAAELAALARRINPHIDVDSNSPTIAIAVGNDFVPAACPTIYAGSNNWDAFISTDHPCPIGGFRNPLGAGAAACLAVANVFRWVFLGQHEDVLDRHFTFSVLDRSTAPTKTPIDLEQLPPVEPTLLVGAGAIGEASTWSLSRAPVRAGPLRIVDDEVVDMSNLQRYVLAERDNVGAIKVDLAAAQFGLHGPLEAVPHNLDWAAFVERFGYTWSRVLVALDSAEGRRSVQATLPGWIANAWTQPGDLGLSTHSFDGPGACVNCLYLPADAGMSKDAVVAQALRIEDRQAEVRALLYKRAPPPADMLQLIAERLNVSLDRLQRFANRPLDDLYVEGICGGEIISVADSGGSEHRLHVPVTHQSALAGVLLAGALLADLAGIRSSETLITRIDLMRPVPDFITHLARPDARGICLCQDPDYLDTYARKYG